MLKTAGIIFLIFSGGLVGIAISKKNLNHIKFLEEYISLILDLKTQISYNQKPLFEILKNYGQNKYLSPIINKCINLSEKSSFEKAWRKSFSNLNKVYGVSLNEENIIKNFASEIGVSDIEAEVNYCNYNISLIKPYLEKLLENKNKDRKLPIVLGFCISLIISIILI